MAKIKLPPVPAPVNPNTGAVYIGVDAGSDLEQQGVNMPGWAKYQASGGVGQLARRGAPKYKVGYQNSKEFARELGNKDPNAIAAYQSYMQQAGLISKYTPGQLDKPTRAAFKELFTRANQTGGTWQTALQDAMTTGQYDPSAASDGGGATQQVVLDDPVSLREAFQSAAQNIYGGDLPDTEVNAMVDAYRNAQLAKSQEQGAVIDSLPDAGTYAQAQIKEKHPQQVNRVKFQDMFGDIMNALKSPTS